MPLGEPEDLGHGGVDDVAQVAVAAAQEEVFVGFPAGAQLHQFVGDGADRLLPGNRHEAGILAAALFRVGALHRRFDTIGIVHLLDGEVRARADLAVVRLAVRVAAHADDVVADHAQLDGAPGRAALAGRGDPAAGVGPERGDAGLGFGGRAK